MFTEKILSYFATLIDVTPIKVCLHIFKKSQNYIWQCEFSKLNKLLQLSLRRYSGISQNMAAPRRIQRDLFCKLTVKRIFGQVLLKNICEGTYFLVKIKDIRVLPKTNAKLIKE